MPYRVEIKRSAAKELASLPRRDQRRVAVVIDALASMPRPPGARKLVGASDTYRIRVRDYRVIYEAADDVLIVLVIRIGHRRDVYRKL